MSLLRGVPDRPVVYSDRPNSMLLTRHKNRGRVRYSRLVPTYPSFCLRPSVLRLTEWQGRVTCALLILLDVCYAQSPVINDTGRMA